MPRTLFKVLGLERGRQGFPQMHTCRQEAPYEVCLRFFVTFIEGGGGGANSSEITRFHSLLYRFKSVFILYVPLTCLIPWFKDMHILIIASLPLNG